MDLSRKYRTLHCGDVLTTWQTRVVGIVFYNNYMQVYGKETGEAMSCERKDGCDAGSRDTVPFYSKFL